MLEFLIIYLSLFLGKVLHLLTKEEIKSGKKYLILSSNLLIFLISIVFLITNFNILNLLLIIPSFFMFKYLKVNYFILGLGSFLALGDIMLLSLFFILCLIFSSLEAFKAEKFMISSILFILPLSLLIIETFINVNSGIFTGILIGGLISLVNKGS